MPTKVRGNKIKSPSDPRATGPSEVRQMVLDEIYQRLLTPEFHQVVLRRSNAARERTHAGA
jgi:hypothetical protein